MNPFSGGKKHKIGLDLFVKGFEKDRLSRAYLALTNTYETDRLILECASLEEMDAEYNDGDLLEEGIYEAVTVRRFSQTDSRMKALARVFSKFLPETIAPAEAIIGKPRKTGMFASVTAQIPFSDGQAITIVFHSPAGDVKKIGPDDEIIAYRWLLNKRDITHVVSPEGEGEVSLEEVGKRIAQLVTKNSDRFQATQKDVRAQNDQLDALKASADALSKENVDLMNGLKDQQDAAAAVQAKVTRTADLVEKQKEINADLENQLSALQAKQKADEAAQAVAAETAAKQAADEAAAAQAEANKQVDEYNRLVSVGQAAVPSVRLQDAETAGKLWEMLQRGEVTQDEWDKYVEDLYASNKATRPEPVVTEWQPSWGDTVYFAQPETPDKRTAVKFIEPRSGGMATIKINGQSVTVPMSQIYNDAGKEPVAPEVVPPVDNQDNAGNVTDPTATPDEATIVDQGDVPAAEPAPTPESAAEPPAVAVLNDLMSGAHDSDTVEFGRILDDAAAELEAAGLMDQYDALLNQAADYLTGLLKEKMKKVM